MDKDIQKYLPLTEATAYILLTLNEPRHGYAIMQLVEEISQGTVKLGPGTLYTAFTTLETEGLIDKAGEENRRKLYIITEKGRRALQEHVRRLQILVRNAQPTIN